MNATTDEVPETTNTNKEEENVAKTKTRKNRRSQEATAAVKTPKKAPKERKPRPSSREPREESALRNGRSLGATVGERLASLKNHKKIGPTVKALSAGEEASNKQLVTLRDTIKEIAADLREKGDVKRASELSATNALVRRLERASR